MTQFELDLHYAKSIVKILDAAYTGTLDNNVHFTIKKSVPVHEEDWIGIKSEYGIIEYNMKDSFFNNMLWSNKQLQIESESKKLYIAGDNMGTSFELITNPEDEATYFQNSLIYEPHIHSMLILVSYINKYINKNDIKSVNVLLLGDVDKFITAANMIGEP